MTGLMDRVLDFLATANTLREIPVTQPTGCIGRLNASTKFYALGRLRILIFRVEQLPTGKTGEPAMAYIPATEAPPDTQFVGYGMTGTFPTASPYVFITVDGKIGANSTLTNPANQIMFSTIWVK